MSYSINHLVGDIEVTVITDGIGTFENGSFPAADPDEIERLLADAQTDAIKTNFNVFLIRSGVELTLVDAGLRGLAPNTGNLPAGLAEIGVSPEEITRVFFTHLHPDHIAGAISSEGAAQFMNAEVLITEAEHELWTDAANFAGKGEGALQYQQLAQSVVDAYGDQISLVGPNADLGGGVTLLPLPGHTPGHSGLRINSGNEQFIIAGDIVHAEALQLANPDIAVVFDMDSTQAAQSRKSMLDMLAQDDIVFSGGHFQQPAIGRVRRDGNGFKLVDL